MSQNLLLSTCVSKLTVYYLYLKTYCLVLMSQNLLFGTYVSNLLLSTCVSKLTYRWLKLTVKYLCLKAYCLVLMSQNFLFSTYVSELTIQHVYTLKFTVLLRMIGTYMTNIFSNKRDYIYSTLVHFCLLTINLV